MKNIVIYENFDGTSLGTYQIISPLHFVIISPILILSFISPSYLIWIRTFRNVAKSVLGGFIILVTASLFLVPIAVVMVGAYGFYGNLKTQVTKTAVIQPVFCVIDKEKKVSAYLLFKNGSNKNIILDVSSSTLSLYVPEDARNPDGINEGYEYELDVVGSSSGKSTKFFSLGLKHEGWLALKSIEKISDKRWELYSDKKLETMHCIIELGAGSPIAENLGIKSFGFFGVPEIRGKVFLAKPKK